MKLFPVSDRDPHGPPPVGPSLRGVAIHWVAAVTPPVSRRGRKFAPRVPERTWLVRRVPFAALTPDGADRVPASEDEARRMVRHAYAIVAVHHPIPSDADVYYEVGTWTA